MYIYIITQYGNTVYKKFKFAQKNKPDKAFGDFRCQTSAARAAKAEVGLSTTGIAGPGGGTPEKPVGLVYIALSDGENTWVAKRMPFGRSKSREWHRHCSASKALDMVRRYLAGLPVDEQ